MHSSRMRTGQSLTVFGSLLFRGRGVSGPGVSGPGECLVLEGGSGPGGWGCLVLGGVWSQGVCWSGTPPVNRMTNRCKNITFILTSFWLVTRMHSSRMRTVCSCSHLPGVYSSMHWLGVVVYPSMHWSEGGLVYPRMHWSGGVGFWSRGCLLWSRGW